MIPQISRLRHPPPKSLDLLDIVDLKDFVVHAAGLLLEEDGYEDGPLGVGVDAAAGTATGEGCEEEGGALGGFVGWRGAEVGSW